MKVNCSAYDRVCRAPNISHYAENTVPSMKHGGGRIMHHGTGKLVRVEGKMDGTKYVAELACTN